MTTNIICTGNSLRGMDLNEIQGHKIAVNFAHEYCDYDEFVCYDDPRPHGFPVDKAHTQIEFGVGIGYHTGSPHGIDRRRDHLIQINSSLIIAINVAIHLGFKTIYVWGADNEITDGYTHFYDEERASEELIKHYNRRFKKNLLELGIVKKSLRADEKVIFMRPDML
jgi:hypothetical protein